MAKSIDLLVRDTAGTVIETYPVPKNYLDGVAAPGINDDGAAGYSVGSLYADKTGNEVYLCQDNTNGAAVWVQVGSGGGGGSGDVVGPASSVANEIVLFDGATGKLIKRASGTGGVAATAGVISYYTLTAAGLALLDDATAADQRTTLGLGTGALLVTDTDPALAANSNANVATQAAVKTYVDGLIAAQDAMVFKGVIDCSANPNYPAADRGWTYRVSVAGKIGGASGPNVEVGDLLLCLTDGTASGNHATVGSAWGIIQVNLDGAVIGPTSATDNAIARYEGTTGRLIQNSAVTVDDAGAVGVLCNLSTGPGLGIYTGVAETGAAAFTIGTPTNLVSFRVSDDGDVIADGLVTAEAFTGGGATFTKALALSGRVTATLSADQNNYAPAGHADAFEFFLDTNSGTTRTITGLAGGVAGRIVIIRTTDSNPGVLALAHASGSSSAANRFDFPTGQTLSMQQGHSAMFQHDGTDWKFRSWFPEDNSINLSKIQAITAGHIVANMTGLVSVPSTYSLSTVLDSVSGSVARGDILYRNATTWVRLPAGTALQYLATGGVGADPAWTTLPSNPTPTQFNQSVSQQGAGFASDTYLTGSRIAFPANKIKVGTRYRLRFDVSKTAAGSAAPVISIRVGTAGTTADTAVATLTFNAQTAADDDGIFDVMVTFRTISSASLMCVGQCTHRRQITGLQDLPGVTVRATSSSFTETTASFGIGVSVNGGASASWTVQLVQATLENLTA